MIRRLLLPLLLATACKQTEEFSGSFDTPAPLAVLDRDPSPFDEPVGYAADLAGGRIRLLGLQRGRYLADDPFASFFRGSALATGDERLLVSLAAVAPDEDHAFVWAADKRFTQLLKVPHVVGRTAEGWPIEAAPELASKDVPAGVTLEGLAFDADQATSETWTFTFDGTLWDVTGSRSGVQPPAFPGVPWSARNGAVTLILRGVPAAGAAATVVVDRGIEEIDLPGTPLEVSVSPDRTTLAVLHDDGAGQVVLRLGDALTGALGDAVPLTAGASPVELAWTQDGATLLVADAGLPVVWTVDVGTATATAHAVPWRTAHVAALSDDDGTRLFVAPAGVPEVWILDPATDRLVDVNAATPEVDGMRFLAPVQGLAPLPLAYDLPTDEDTPPRGRSVAVSLLSGAVVFMREDDGCLVRDPLGPRTQILGSTNAFADYEPDYPIRVPGTAYLQAIEDGVRHVVVNPCAGIAPTETWQLTYDALEQGWVARGSLSDEQTAIVREDERYVSDQGEISLVVRAGAEPSEDGWRLAFNVLSGELRADGDQDGDGVRDLNLDRPGRPVVFTRLDHGEAVPEVVVPATSADFVCRIDPRTGLIDAVWD